MKRQRRVIGVDESGKGDFFGPLVIAAFLAADADLEKLREVGVRDGKLIADKKLLGIDEYLREIYPHAIIRIMPREYNTRYQEIKNLNKLLAEGHARAIEQVLSGAGAELAISDKFGKPELIERELAQRNQLIELHQIERGESVIQVAAASILARAAFLRAIDEMSVSCGHEIPRGASAAVDRAGREIVARLGPEVLPDLVKMHFKNYGRVVKQRLFRD
jgi:ribonuclease HIII